MVKERVTKRILFFILFIGILIIGNKAQAATADISASKKEINVGDTVKVTIKVNAAQWDLSISASGLTYVSGTKRFTELDNASSNLSKSATATYKATKAGTYTIKLSGDITDISGDNKDISDSAKITVKEKTTTSNNTGSTGNNNSSDKGNNSSTTAKKSTNANLSTLGVTPKEYDFSGFTKTKTNYSVTVPNDVDSLKVAYKTEDSKASVKVSGNSGFEVGSNNEIKVVVTAEDGKTTKTYTIKVTKLAEDTEKPGNVIDDDNNEGLYLTSLTIKGIKLSPTFAKDTYSYTATLSDASVSELEVEAKANNEKANIAISGNTDLVEGENTINLILTLDDSPEQTIYQVVVNKEAVALPAATTTSLDSNQSSNNNDFMGSIKTYLWIVIAVVVLVVIAIIVLIILLRRENKKMQEEDTDDDEYNVYKNDANEFQSKNENFIESLYKQRDEKLYNQEELSEVDKETLEEINKQTDEIFKEDKVQGQLVEYDANELEEEKSLEDKKRKGRHF